MYFLMQLVIPFLSFASIAGNSEGEKCVQSLAEQVGNTMLYEYILLSCLP